MNEVRVIEEAMYLLFNARCNFSIKNRATVGLFVFAKVIEKKCGNDALETNAMILDSQLGYYYGADCNFKLR